MTSLLTPTAEEVRMMDTRMLATATCTEEKFSWEPPGRVTFLGPSVYTRVALFPGTRTVQTELNIANVMFGRDFTSHMPALVDADFTIPGQDLFDRMVQLDHQSDTYMTVRNGVAPACIHTLCNTSYVRIRIYTRPHTPNDPAYTHVESQMSYAGDHDPSARTQRRQTHHGTGQGAQSAVRETV